MSDLDSAGHAWRVSPSDYLAKRPPEGKVPTPSSCYLSMRDGCKLAIDVYVPERPVGQRFPTVLIATPYYRRFKVRAGAVGTEPSPNIAQYRDMFVPRGYAMVVVDVRGTGASHGTRDSFRSPRERDDFREVIEWIVQQPWSDNSVGCTGISYLGAAADFIASTGHPSVKAIAPLFAVWDTYSDNYYPGGIYLKELARIYDEMMVALDHDDRRLIRKFAYYSDPNLEGPRPVDEDADASSCREAVRQHLGNFRMPDFIREFPFKDDALPYDPSFTSASFSPYNYVGDMRPDIAVYSVSGWTDGAGYANGAISRFLTIPSKHKYLLLGPWDHGARINTSPWRNRETPEFPMMGELLRFFDQHLAGRETGLLQEAPVHLFSMHREVWRAAPSWPPIDGHREMFLQNATLADAPFSSGELAFRADFSSGTGNETRYERIAGIDCRRYYSDWQGRDEHMLKFTSEPLSVASELSGHVVIDLTLKSSEPDATIFVYLVEIEADGHERYVTEGLLRALHRAESPAPDHHRTSWPYRTYSRKHARPMLPGQPGRLRFALLPISWTFEAGSRIRVAIAGADADHCILLPHGRPPEIRVIFGGATPSLVSMPLREAER